MSPAEALAVRSERMLREAEQQAQVLGAALDRHNREATFARGFTAHEALLLSAHAQALAAQMIMLADLQNRLDGIVSAGGHDA
jgi:hypothetical protein